MDEDESEKEVKLNHDPNLPEDEQQVPDPKQNINIKTVESDTESVVAGKVD